MEAEEISKREFLTSLRGYDRDEVDAYLREVAEEVSSLRQQLTSAGTATPPSSSPPVQAETKAPADAAPSDAYKRVGEETSKILVVAEQVANEIKEKARREAAELLADARQLADKQIRESKEGKEAADAEIAKLLGTRSMLATQLEDVRRRLDETIARLQAPVDLPAAMPPRTAPATPKPAPTPQSPPPVKQEAPAAPPLPAPQAVTKTEPAPPTPKAEPAPPPAEPKKAEAPASSLQGSSASALKERPKPPPSPSVFVATPTKDVTEVGQDAGATKTALPKSDVETTPQQTDLGDLLAEIREERQAGARQVEEALSSIATPPVVAEPAPKTSSPKPEAEPAGGPLGARAAALGEDPLNASRRMKRLLQEDQNELLDKLRTKRGKGTADENMVSAEDHEKRFSEGLTELLDRAFNEGRKVGGSTEPGDSSKAVSGLIARQLVTPLRAELSKAVSEGLAAQDTPTSISERASDVYRVWKGVRTELLGEGMVYAAFHQGLMDVWNTKGAAQKTWVLSPDEPECPKDICRKNSEAGGVAIGGAFPSGHLAPPAHGGCTCTLQGPHG